MDDGIMAIPDEPKVIAGSEGKTNRVIDRRNI
jgi:hypothetical protein